MLEGCALLVGMVSHWYCAPINRVTFRRLARPLAASAATSLLT
jgi:hypothetical protein